MSASAPWPAPAKINLFLHITGRRSDGYHLLQTLFQFLDFGDLIALDVREDGIITRSGGVAGIDTEDDLAVRAARALAAATGCPLGADIAIDKRIPAGGGLGGGSSDAATVLVGLNDLWGTGVDLDGLARIGLALGADVPVFVHGRAAWAEGVGEQITPAEPPGRWFVVVDPGVAVATADIFQSPDLTRNSPPITMSDFLSGRGENVCEPVVRALYPEVGAALDWLRKRAGWSRMTGTGSCIFAPFADEDGARQVLADLPGGWTGFVAAGRNRSPLADRLQAQPSA